MEQAVAPRTASQAHELRVLEGAQHGARAALAAGVGCVLASHPDGHAEGADVVLREEGAAPVRVRVTVDLRDALIEVLEGEVHLGDQTLTAGTQAAWAMHAPLRIGRSVVAFGRAGSTGWPAAAAAAPDETHAESASAVARKLRTPMSRRPETWLAAMGGLVLLICGAAFGTAHFAAAAPAPENPQVPSLAAALRNSEFSTLRTGARKDGQLDLFGRLDTIDQRARLDAWLAEHQFNTAVDVQVDEALARDVTETFRVNGVAVQAQVLGAGTVSVETAEPDAARLARAEEVVRRDVRGLTKLAVQNTAKPPKKPLPPMTDDPGKRIASLVPGDPAYIVTADGSRYFVGSMLPSGHRIAAIGSNSVTLENDGETTTLNF